MTVTNASCNGCLATGGTAAPGARFSYSGTNGLSVTAGGSLTFTPANFSAPQNVTITASSSGTGIATFTASATGLTSVSVTATEVVPSGGGGPAPQHRRLPQ